MIDLSVNIAGIKMQNPNTMIKIIEGLSNYLEEKGFSSLSEWRTKMCQK
ncbi:hypothetical protein KKC49_00590 [Patescibacteria group bacterium]|nr:hypothetical protein [Patescibacteria group bacterium]MBU4367354.1 hypothetical protein [Patescibacteria group bacterium]MCG2699654.1 hypothetical protein [Candidatus Parcubacteria bacterium]